MFGLQPRYFDIIHYFVSSDILVSRLEATGILQHLDHVAKECEVAPTWHQHVGLYFAFQAITYCEMYAHQTDLHKQATWQMETWQTVLQAITAADQS